MNFVNMNKKYLKRIFSLSLVFLLVSCELESIDYGSINSDLFPASEKDVEALVTANAYGAFRNDGYSGIFNIADGLFITEELNSDLGESGWEHDQLVYGKFDAYVDRLGVKKTYTNYTPWISKMTLTIERIKDFPMDENLKARYIAELRLGRGWLANLLYGFYGPIVIADVETLKNPTSETVLPRLTEEQMKEYIETELIEAAKVLPYNYDKNSPNYGRFTKGLANTVLLKFYMQTEQWSKAETIGRELMKPEYGYKLMSEYKDIFTLANEGNTETIWACVCKPGYQQHKWMPHVYPKTYDTTPSNIVKWGNGGWKIAWKLFDKYASNDKRLESILYEYQGNDGLLYNRETNAGSRDLPFYFGAIPVKYENDMATTGEDSQVDWIIYRYADVLTLTAEAIVRNNNAVTKEAVDLLNAVHTRSVPDDAYSLSDFNTIDDFLDEILDERGRELFFEGCRRADIIRHGKYEELMIEKAQHAGQVTFITLDNQYYRRAPIPNEIIREGKGIIVNNPGYSNN